MRTVHCRLIGLARCTSGRWVTIWVGLSDLFVQVQGEKIFGPRQLKAFAQADGFDDAYDMAAFWRAEHGTDEDHKFNGKLIEWEPDR